MQGHLDGDRTFFEIVEGKAGEKRVGREAVGMDHAPGRVAETSIHCRKYRVNLGIGPSRDLISVV